MHIRGRRQIGRIPCSRRGFDRERLPYEGSQYPELRGRGGKIRAGTCSHDPRKDSLQAVRPPCGLRPQPPRTGAYLLYRKTRHQRRESKAAPALQIFPRNIRGGKSREKTRVHRTGNGARDKHYRLESQPCRDPENRCPDEGRA